MSGQMPGGFNPYGGAQNPYQRQFNRAPNVFGQSAAALNGAMDSTFQGLGYRPMMVNAQAGSYDPAQMSRSALQQGSYNPAMARGTSYNGATVNAGSMTPALLRDQDLSAYMNPYTSNVIDTTLADIERARQMQENVTNAQATAAGAFGGSRQALRETENNRNFLDQSARSAAQLRNAGFVNAQQMGLADVGAMNNANQFNVGLNMQGQLANQASQNAASQFGAQSQLQANLANAAARNAARQFGSQNQFAGNLANMTAANQAGQFNASNALRADMANQGAIQNANAQRLAAAGQLGNLANLGFGMGNSANAGVQQQGAYARSLMQQLMGAGRGQFERFAQQPYMQQQLLNNTLSGLPIPQTTTQSRSPGLFDYLTLGASVLASDERLKDGLTRIGTYKGFPMYRWRWNKLAESLSERLGPTVGVVAQEVRKLRPDAVTEGPDGFLRVNYGAL